MYQNVGDLAYYNIISQVGQNGRPDIAGMKKIEEENNPNSSLTLNQLNQEQP